MENKKMIGYFFAFITIFIWANTYFFTVKLLTVMQPMEIVVIRFLLAYIILFILYPKIDLKFDLKKEFYYFICGVLGITLYYFLECTSIKFTQTSNYALIVSSIPLFTAIIAHFMHSDEPFNKNLIYGFITAMIGISLVILNGSLMLNLNPIGDLLALFASIIFAAYSNFLKKGNDTNYLLSFRKIFGYGVITTLPLIYMTGYKINLSPLKDSNILLNLAFLSIFASIICSILWQKSIKLIGVNTTTKFIYLVPLLTMISGYFFLNEKINIFMISGGFLILAGVYLSKNRNKILIKIDNKNKSDKFANL